MHKRLADMMKIVDGIEYSVNIADIQESVFHSKIHKAHITAIEKFLVSEIAKLSGQQRSRLKNKFEGILATELAEVLSPFLSGRQPRETDENP